MQVWASGSSVSGSKRLQDAHRQRPHEAQPFAGRQLEACLDVSRALLQHLAMRHLHTAGRHDDRVALLGRCQAPDLVGPESTGDAQRAARKAGAAPEQVDRHQPTVGEHATAGRVKHLIVENRRGGVMVVKVHVQHIDRLQMRITGHPARRVLVDDRQPCIVPRQPEPLPAGSDHFRIDLNRRGLHPQRAVAEPCQRRRTQAQLHRVALAQRGGLPPQHPGAHALDVLELQLVGLADAHRALHPDRVQVQEAHAVEFAQRRRAPGRCSCLRHGPDILGQPRCGPSAARQAEILSARPRPACAGLVDGSFSSGSPGSPRMARASRNASAPLQPIARRPGRRSSRSDRSLGAADSMAASRLPTRTQDATASHRPTPWASKACSLSA
mmetsp:Transcript_4996/g.18197  ORF Transcript_4996/g.18197 Transcript_4996/m.18197 type:complete len:384 (+) Transcript_4996:2034-3185(+)